MTTLNSFLIVILVLLSLNVKGLHSRRKKYGCVLPKEPVFGHFAYNRIAKQITYVCDPGYTLDMVESRRICQRNGRWTGKDGDCITLFTSTRCQKPEAPRNGNLTYYENENGDYEVTFYCNPGFLLAGAVVLTCKRDGNWYGGTFPVCKSHQTVRDIANNFKEAFIDPLAAATADSTDSDVNGKLSVGKTGLDIFFLMDVSASISQESLQTSKECVTQIITEFGISENATGGTNGTRVAVYTFSSETKTVFELDDQKVRTIRKAIRKINSITSQGGGTNLRTALKHVVDANRQLKKEKSRYGQATRAVFVLTDAEATFNNTDNNMQFVKSYANILKAAPRNFEVFTIGVGSNIDRETMELIASQPKHEHVFLLNDFKDLKEVKNIIAEKNIDYGQCGVSGNFEVQKGEHETKKGAFPWIAWVGVTMTKDDAVGRPGQSYTCGGVLLCQRYLLTVAHCVSYINKKGKVSKADPKMINVHLADHRLYTEDDTEIIVPVRKFWIHPNYTGEVLYSDDDEGRKKYFGVRLYDFAILDLGTRNKRPKLDKYIRPICFPTYIGPDKKKREEDNIVTPSEAIYHSMLSSNEKGYVVGWGHAPINANLSFLPWDTQYQNRRRLQPMSKCVKRFPGIDTDLFFCAFDAFKEERKYCRGDVGGPFMVEMSGSRFTMLGMAARTYDCDKDGFNFSIYQSVLHRSVSDWVGRRLKGCNRYRRKEKKRNSKNGDRRRNKQQPAVDNDEENKPKLNNVDGDNEQDENSEEIEEIENGDDDE